jgi:hypothetical protein
MVFGYDYELVPAQQNVSWSAFSNELRFNYTIPSERFVLGRECFILLKVRVIYTNNTGVSQTLGDFASGAYLAKNPVLCFFKSIQLNVNDVCVTRNIQDISSVNTLWRSCFDSALQVSTIDSSNLILPHSISQTEANYSAQNQYLFNGMTQQMEMIAPIPLPAFQSNDPLPPHAKLQLVFMVDPSYANNLIKFVDPTASIKVGNLDAQGNNPNGNNSIGVGIADMQLYMYKAHDYELQKVQHSIRMKQFYSQVINLNGSSGSSNYNVPVPSGKQISHIMFAFINPTSLTGAGNTNTLYYPTEFSSHALSGGYLRNNGTDAISTLSNFQCQYAGRLYPNPQYNSINMNLATVTNETGDTTRMFMDFINSCGTGHLDRAGSLYSLNNWYAEPILCFKTITEPTTNSDNIIVMLNFKTGYNTNSRLLMVCLYEEFLKFNYNENGVIEHLIIEN